MGKFTCILNSIMSISSCFFLTYKVFSDQTEKSPLLEHMLYHPTLLEYPPTNPAPSQLSSFRMLTPHVAIFHSFLLRAPVHSLISLCLRLPDSSQRQNTHLNHNCAPNVLLVAHLPAEVTKYNWMAKGRGEMHSTLNNQCLWHTRICWNTRIYLFLNLHIFLAIGNTNLLKIWLKL